MKAAFPSAAFVLVAGLLAAPSHAADPTGKEVFAQYCSYCHAAKDAPGSEQLRRTRGADKALLAERTDLAADYISYVVRHGLKAMPPFVPSDLTDPKLKLLSAYLVSPLPR